MKTKSGAMRDYILLRLIAQLAAAPAKTSTITLRMGLVSIGPFRLKKTLTGIELSFFCILVSPASTSSHPLFWGWPSLGITKSTL